MREEITVTNAGSPFNFSQWSQFFVPTKGLRSPETRVTVCSNRKLLHVRRKMQQTLKIMMYC